MEIHDEHILVPCNSSNASFADSFADLSGIVFEFLPNGSIYEHGLAFWTKHLGSDIGEVFYNVGFSSSLY